MRISGVRGFTLIEALVAVLVLSIGLLGVAAMQLKALQSSHVSHQRTIASMAAQDAVERLWVTLGENSVQACPDADPANWKADWSTHLSLRDVTTITEDSTYCEYGITVGWVDDRFEGEDVSTLEYRIKLPKK
nr:type IV pilus modification protein PilV [Halomonas stenophila]